MKLSQWLNKKGRAEENRMINIVRKSEWFDERWYVSHYQDVFKKRKDPARHYCFKGWMENRNPSENFSTADYLRRHPECDICPLVFEYNRNADVDLSDDKSTSKSNNKKKKAHRGENGSVTVITPTYNRSNYLDKALNILKSQTLDEVKFIIVDDGSTDGSAEYIEKAIEGDKRFVLIKNDTNQGPSVARNKALDLSKTEYVGFFDIDDEIPTDYYEKLYEQAIKSSADIVFTCYNDVKHRIKKISEKADKYSALRNGAIWDKLYNTAMLKKNNIKFAENLYTADNLFNIEAFHAAKKIVLTDEPRYSYELHNDSIGKDEKLTEKRKEDIISICNKAVDFALNHDFDFPSRVGLYDFLKRTYDCYADDVIFQAKLQPILSRTGVKVNVAQIMTKYNKKEYKMIEDSAYFNPKYYKWHNPQLWFKSKKDLVNHYLTIGWLKGKNPSVEFDGNKYLAINEDVAKAGMNPLIHYEEYGINEARPYEAVTGMGEKIKYALTYPIRVKEEYDRLVAEIKALENMK